MKIANVDLEREVLIIAEVGNNHEGSFTLAQDLVGLAAEAGAKAVKFQTIRTENLVHPRDAARFARLKGFELTFEQFERLSRQARDAGILFMSTPFDPGAAKFLAGIVDGMKVASGDNNFFPLLRSVAETGLPTVLSSGLMTLDEVRKSSLYILDVWKELGIRQELAVLHCVSAYPAPPEDLNLRCIQTMRKELGLTVGYSDHAIGLDAALASVACGGRIIEKHFTVRKDYSDFRDHQLSADPADMRELVARVKELEAMLGSGIKEPAASEKGNAQALRRSIVAARDLDVGHQISLSDLNWIRPGGGLEPGEESSVVGKKLKQAVKRGDLLTLAQFA